MKQQLKQSFFQVFTISFLWLTFIMTRFFAREQVVSINYLWNIAGVSLICGGLFGVMYHALWNYFTLKPVWNILISSAANTIGGFTALWLLSRTTFYVVWNWALGVLLLTVLLHIIAFYFYAKHESKKQANILNEMLHSK